MNFYNLLLMRSRALGLAASLALLCAAPALIAQTEDYKIDRGLMTSLTDSADAAVPFFVIFKDRADLAALSQIPDRATRSSAVIEALQAVADRSQAGIRGFLRGQGVAFTPFWIQNTIYVPRGTLGLARALARRPEVLAIVPEDVLQVPPVSASAGAAVQAVEWNIAKIRADQAWSTNTGAGMLVANIDTGVRPTHEALASNFSGKFYDPTGACGGSVCDNNGHGTHTMGTIAGSGGIGVAPGATWMACKGCITSSCFSSHLVACAQYIADPDGVPATADFPDVVNNSWGGSHSRWFEGYVDSWRALGIFPAFSAGNSGPACGSAGSPGEYAVSVASGATDINDVIASFSGRGPSSLDAVIKPDVAAPGVNVRSSYYSSDTSYAWGSGTSMASPHTAGLVALVWAAKPAMRGNIAATEQLLRDTAVKLQTTENCGGTAGQVPNNTYGYGRIDALAAVGGGGSTNQPPTVTITSPPNGAEFACPATVNFTGTASDLEDKDLTAKIAWTEGSSRFGTGGTASKSYSCSELGFHTVVASVIDSGGLTDTDSITISVYDASVPQAPTLYGMVDGATVHLNWTSTADRYELQRRSPGRGKNSPGDWATLVGDPLTYTATWYDDTPGDGDWEYHVRGCNEASCSDYSNIVNVKVGNRGGPKK